MSRTHSALLLATALGLAATASAQTPVFVALGAGTLVTDIKNTPNGIVAVGTDGVQGLGFLWTPNGGFTYITGMDVSVWPKLSDDGLVVGAQQAGNVNAGIWTQAGGWVNVPGLGGQSGSVQTAFYDLSGNGAVAVGLSYTIGNIGHAFRYESGTTIDLTPPWNNNPSRANAVNFAGDVVAGWRDQGVRQGVVWQNGVLQSMTYAPAGGPVQRVGEALGMNSAGSYVVGYNLYDGATNTAGWIWERANNSLKLLPNLPGFGSPLPSDVTDDGSIVVGSSGGFPFGRNAIIWTNRVPENFKDWLLARGETTSSAYTQLGNITAIANGGLAFCGYGAGAGFGEPAGWLVLMPDVFTQGTAYCSGDGSAAACPCGNNGLAGRGCANSVNPDGARLRGTGFASLGTDSLTLIGEGMPNSNALYFQGTATTSAGAGFIFGDGLRCAGGTIVRLGTKTNAAGTSRFPLVGDQSVSLRGQVQQPSSRYYQVWYRNAAAYCSAGTFNLTNGLDVTWTP